MRLAAILIVGLLITSVAWWRFSLSSRSSIGAKAIASAVASSQPANSNSQGFQATQSPGHQEVTNVRAQLARRDKLTLEFESAASLLDVVRAVLPAAQGQDAEAQLLISRALEYCDAIESRVLTEQSALRRSLGDPSANPQLRKKALALSTKCDALAHTPQSDVGTSDDWLKLAAANGNAVALFNIATNDHSDQSTSARVESLHRALDAKDPDVINLLLTRGDVRDGPEASQVSENPWIETAVISLVDCQLGHDCSESGAYYQSTCISQNCEHANSVQRIYELKLNPQEYQLAQDYANRLVASLGSGRYDWPEAAAMEQEIRNSGLN